MNERKFLRQREFNVLSEGDRLKEIIRLATYAPSSHNTQPWLFRVKDKTIELLPNFKRALTASDPQNRELFLSVGAAFSNMAAAAESYGLSFESIFPTAGGEVAGRIIFRDLKAKREDTKTLESIVKRHANRSNFEDKKIPEQFLNKVRSFRKDGVSIHVITNGEAKEKATAVVLKATREAFLDKGFTDELSQWMKPGLAKYKDGMPGYNIGVPLPISFFMPFAIKYLNLSGAQVKMVEPLLKTAPAFVVLTTLTDDILDFLDAGYLFEKIFLEAEKEGIKIGVFGAAVEIGENYKELQKILSTSERPQVFFRLGYSKEVPVMSPRLDLKDVIINE